MADTSSLDTPSVDAYVSSLIASGVVEEGAFYAWTTPSGEVYYGPNPRPSRIVAPRTGRTPVDPLPTDIEPPDITNVEQIIRQNISDIYERHPGSDPGSEIGDAKGSAIGYGKGADFQLSEDANAANIAQALIDDNINNWILDKFDINIAETLGFKEGSVSYDLANAVQKGVAIISAMTSPITGLFSLSIGAMSRAASEDIMSHVGSMAMSDDPNVSMMLSQAIANLPNEDLNDLSDRAAKSYESVLDSMLAPNLTNEEMISLAPTMRGQKALMERVNNERQGTSGLTADVTADDLGLPGLDNPGATMADPNLDLVYDINGKISGMISDTIIGGAAYKSGKGIEDYIAGRVVSGKSSKGQALIAAVQKGKAEEDPFKRGTSPPLVDDPRPGVSPRLGQPAPAPPDWSPPSTATEDPLELSDEDWYAAEEGKERADKIAEEAKGTESQIDLSDYGEGYEGYDEDPSSYFHEGGLINKNNAWMGGEDSTDHDYQPLADARPVLDEGGMVKKPSYQAGGKVKPQQNPYTAFQNKANQQTKQMMQPKQPPGQRPQPMTGQPRQPSAKGAPQAPGSNNVNITAKKGEFIIPVDVVKIKGTEFFEKAISGARKSHFESTGRRNAQKKQRSAKTISRFDPNAPKSRRNPVGLPKIAGATPTPGTPPVRPKVKRPVPGQRPTSPVSHPNTGGPPLRQPILS